MDRRWAWPALYIVLMFISIPMTPWILQAARGILAEGFGVLLRIGLILFSGGLLIFFFPSPKAWSPRRKKTVLLIALLCGWQFITRGVPEDLIHLPQYGLLTVLLLRRFLPNGPEFDLDRPVDFVGSPRTFVNIVPLGSALGMAFMVGVLDELYQGWLPNRVYDLVDIGTNGIGVLIGFLFWYGEKAG